MAAGADCRRGQECLENRPLRIAFWQQKEVPNKVAINEAIELAKTFGGDSSENSSTASLAPSTGRWAGKKRTRKKKKQEKFTEEKLGGAVVYKRKDWQKRRRH